MMIIIKIIIITHNLLCVYVSMYHVCVYARTSVRMHECVHVSIRRVFMYLCTDVCICIMYARLCVCVCVWPTFLPYLHMVHYMAL